MITLGGDGRQLRLGDCFDCSGVATSVEDSFSSAGAAFAEPATDIMLCDLRFSFFYAASSVLVAAPIEASEGGLPVRVEVLGPSSCPSANEFVREVDQHLPARSARADEPAHALVLQIVQRGDAFAGRLESPSTSGIEAREVSAASCGEVMAALALSAALSLEGKPPPDANVGETDPRFSDPATPPQRNPEAAQQAVPRDGGAEEETAPVPRQFLLGIGVRSWSAALPLLGGPEIAVGFRAPSRNWEASLRLGALFQLQSGSPHLNLFSSHAGLSLCWMPLHTNFRLDGGLCATSDVALVQGQGVSLSDASSVVLPWGASGAATHVRWSFAPGLFVEADAGAQGVWLAPEWTAQSPPRMIESAGRVNVSASVGLGWFF